MKPSNRYKLYNELYDLLVSNFPSAENKELAEALKKFRKHADVADLFEDSANAYKKFQASDKKIRNGYRDTLNGFQEQIFSIMEKYPTNDTYKKLTNIIGAFHNKFRTNVLNDEDTQFSSELAQLKTAIQAELSTPVITQIHTKTI